MKLYHKNYLLNRHSFDWHYMTKSVQYILLYTVKFEQNKYLYNMLHKAERNINEKNRQFLNSVNKKSSNTIFCIFPCI